MVYHPTDYGTATPAKVQPILDKYGSVETTPLTVGIKKREDNLEIKLD